MRVNMILTSFLVGPSFHLHFLDGGEVSEDSLANVSASEKADPLYRLGRNCGE
jgi:hypothetical protein